MRVFYHENKLELKPCVIFYRQPSDKLLHPGLLFWPGDIVIIILSRMRTYFSGAEVRLDGVRGCPTFIFLRHLENSISLGFAAIEKVDTIHVNLTFLGRSLFYKTSSEKEVINEATVRTYATLTRG